MKDRDGCSYTAAILDVLLRGTEMVRQRRGFTPLEISTLETQTKQSPAGWVKIWYTKRTPLEKQVKQSLTGQRFLTGFTVIELILIVIFIGAFAAISIPRLNFAIISRNKADVVARKIVTDLRRTRRMAISNAATNTFGFELRMVAPLPYTSYVIADRTPPSSTVDTLTIDSSVSISCPGVPFFWFGPLGNLNIGSGTELTVAAGGKSFTITVIPATGTIKCVED